MNEMTVMRRCERCMGTGELESSDSTEDGWWDCGTCKGTGEVADRRAPDPQLAGAVALREAAEAVSAAWDAWMEDEDGEGQDAVAEAIGALRHHLGGQ